MKILQFCPPHLSGEVDRTVRCARYADDIVSASRYVYRNYKMSSSITGRGH